MRCVKLRSTHHSHCVSSRINLIEGGQSIFLSLSVSLSLWWPSESMFQLFSSPSRTKVWCIQPGYPDHSLLWVPDSCTLGVLWVPDVCTAVEMIWWYTEWIGSLGNNVSMSYALFNKRAGGSCTPIIKLYQTRITSSDWCLILYALFEVLPLPSSGQVSLSKEATAKKRWVQRLEYV